MATISGSAPRPTRKRPVAITGKLGDRAVTTPAIKQMIPKIIVDFLVPMLSMMMPPRSSTIIAAQLYAL